MKDMENWQKNILTSICEIPRTSYFALLSEIGIWPVEQLIEYKKIMLLSQILESENSRLIKQIIEEQIKNPWGQCWVKMVKVILEKYDINENQIRQSTKEQLRKVVKNKITAYLQKEIELETQCKTKSRFCTTFKQKEYITNLKYKDCITMIKTKLNMLYLKCNYKGNFKENLACPLCASENDTTEHIFRCKEINKGGNKIPDINLLNKDTHNEEICNFINTAMEKREKSLPQLMNKVSMDVN